MYSSLKLQEFSMYVSLGCSEAEREHLQEVRLSINIEFKSVPQAAISDRLEETVCYARLTEALVKYCEGKEFALIEKLGFECFRILKDHIILPHVLTLDMHKVRPPVPNLRGGAVFTIRD